MVLLAAVLLASCDDGETPANPGHQSAGDRVAVVFSGGHETDPVDRGRPVALIAGALGVKPEVFREAFSHVQPAPAGTRPDEQRVRTNKAALMSALGPLGVTNDRLDEVSNYYRYQPGRGEMWPTREAKAFAVVENGQVTAFEITDGGSGYNSPPEVSVPGFPSGNATTEIAFGSILESNGAVKSINLPERRASP